MDNPGPNQPAQPVNLLDEESLLSQFEYASTGQRFVNFIVDNLAMKYALGYFSQYALGMILNAIDPRWMDGMMENGWDFYSSPIWSELAITWFITSWVRNYSTA